MKQSQPLAILKLILAVVVWGGSFVATKIALEDIAPVTIIWLRFGIGLVILGLATLWRKEWATPQARELPYLALLGFLGITFHQWLQSTGLQTSQATTTSWIVATIPIFMALLGWLALHEKLYPLQILGILIAAAGVLLVVTQGDFAALAHGKIGTWGDLLVLISAPNWAVFSVLSRRGLRRHPPARLIFLAMAFGWLLTTIQFFLGPGLGDVAHLSRSGWWAILFLGVFCSGLAYIYWYDGLQALPVAQVGAFVYLEPFVTVVVAALLLDEPLLLPSILGGVAIIAGVQLVQSRPRRRLAAQEEIS